MHHDDLVTAVECAKDNIEAYADRCNAKYNDAGHKLHSKMIVLYDKFHKFKDPGDLIPDIVEYLKEVNHQKDIHEELIDKLAEALEAALKDFKNKGVTQKNVSYKEAIDLADKLESKDDQGTHAQSP